MRFILVIDLETIREEKNIIFNKKGQARTVAKTSEATTRNVVEEICWKHIYFGLSGHYQELHETEKYRILWGVFYEGGVERTSEGVKTCVKHSTMKEDIVW